MSKLWVCPGCGSEEIARGYLQEVWEGPIFFTDNGEVDEKWVYNEMFDDEEVEVLGLRCANCDLIFDTPEE